MIINIICNSSDHTVHLPESVRVCSISLIEATLPNSWYNLRERGVLAWTGHSRPIKIESGHYNMEDLKEILIPAIDESVIRFLYEEPQDKHIMGILKPITMNIELIHLLGLMDIDFRQLKLPAQLPISLENPNVFYIRCDLLDPLDTLVVDGNGNAVPSQTLACLPIRGERFQRVTYTPVNILPVKGRGVLTNSFRISVHWHSGKLIRFHARKLHFVLKLDVANSF